VPFTPGEAELFARLSAPMRHLGIPKAVQGSLVDPRAKTPERVDEICTFHRLAEVSELVSSELSAAHSPSLESGGRCVSPRRSAEAGVEVPSVVEAGDQRRSAEGPLQ
jgi:hypothetical protein